MITPPHDGEQAEPETLSPVPEWLVELNQQLTTAAAEAAEQAFGMGCAVSLVPMVIIMGVAFLLGARHWVSLSLVGIALFLLATAWAIFVAYQAHRNGPRQAWQEHLREATAAGLEARDATLAQLSEEAQEILAEGSPLLKALRGEFD